MNRREFTKTVLATSSAFTFGRFSAPGLFAGNSGNSKKASKYIDVHTHIGRYTFGNKNLSPKQLVEWMDEHDIEKSVVLPLVSPESTVYLQPPSKALDAAKEFPDRLIPFCCVDPRTAVFGNAKYLTQILKKYKDQGAKGLGEHKVGLLFDDPLMMRLYASCEEVGLPVLFHIDTKRGKDELGLPRLENAIKSHPNLTFIGHGPGWWASITGSAKSLGGYSKGKVTEGGAIDRLMDKYPNIYGDLSAGSGANSISRDKEFGRDFMIRRKDRLMFGTDYLQPGQAVPQFELFDSLNLPEEVQASIYKNNAIRVLKLDS